MGEFTYKKADREFGTLYSKWFLAKQSIRVAEGGASMQLRLPTSKTDPFRKGITLTIAATNDARCPVHAMTRLEAIDYHQPPSSPLFCIGRDQQQAFTREHVVRSLQRLALAAGLEQGTWNGHSFRRGAATWAAQRGITDSQIQILGRWRSDAYRAYIEYSIEERISLSKRFQHQPS